MGRRAARQRMKLVRMGGSGSGVDTLPRVASIMRSLQAMFRASVQARSFTYAMTYQILLIVVIGGIGSPAGSILGSFL